MPKLLCTCPIAKDRGPRACPSLGDRMKRYEAVSSGCLSPRTPAVVRVDGRAFHTWTIGLDRPFDLDLITRMRKAAELTAADMQGCKLVYVQSDEASFLLSDLDSIETQPWFGYDLPKVVSISASLFTAAFNIDLDDFKDGLGALKRPALFDARAFNVPLSDVANYFLWRALDWRRNSINMLAQHYFSVKELHGKSQLAMLEMLQNRSVEWGCLPEIVQRGSYYDPKNKQWIAPPPPSYQDIALTVRVCGVEGA